jgi:hypothetical protein
MIFFGWSFVFFIVFLGPVVIQTPARGHYFGISGLWCAPVFPSDPYGRLADLTSGRRCWITPAYHTEQIWLEYFFVRLSPSMSKWTYPGPR